MKIDRQIHGDVTVLILEGRLDTSTAPTLDAAFSAAYGEGARKFVWDLEKLTYISSSGLRSVLQALKSVNAGGRLVLCAPNRTVMEVFEISGFKSLLSIHSDRPTALHKAA